MAKLFRVIAFSEEIHGERALRVLREIGNTEANLKECFESEKNVAQVAYEKFIKLAYDLEEKEAALHFRQSRDVEGVHAKLYKNALNDLIGERVTTYYVCTVCGYISDGILPEECPVCGEKVLSPKVSQTLYEKIQQHEYVEETLRIPVLEGIYA